MAEPTFQHNGSQDISNDLSRLPRAGANGPAWCRLGLMRMLAAQLHGLGISLRTRAAA